MCVTSLLCGPRARIYGRFMGFYVNVFLSIKVYQGWALQRSGSTDSPKDVKSITAVKKLLTLGVGDSLLLPLFSFSGIDVNGSKRLSPTPRVSNLSLRPCRYLSTVTRSSSQGSVDGFRQEKLQRFATFDSLSRQRRLTAR